MEHKCNSCIKRKTCNKPEKWENSAKYCEDYSDVDLDKLKSINLSSKATPTRKRGSK